MATFKGKTVLVVGASSGVGAALARRLATEGANVHLAARRHDRLEEQVQAIRTAGGSATGHACDIASGDQVAALFVELERGGVALDAMVSTAAVVSFERFAVQPEARWREMLAINLGGAIAVTQHALRQMLPRERGHIVHITSVAGTLAIPGLAIYSTSKAGLSHFLDAMRGEYGKSGVRFTEIEIGNTAGTDAGRDTVLTEYFATMVQRWTGAPAMLEVDEVVDAVIYAMSTPERARIDHIVLRELAEIPT